jgi:iron(II)-dependent oxidoreductase
MRCVTFSTTSRTQGTTPVEEIVEKTLRLEVLGSGIALRATIVAELELARARTQALLAPLSDSDLTKQHSPLMSPLVWDLAHIAWYEEYWLLRQIGGREATDPVYDDIYDAFKHGRADRPNLPLLDPARARAFAADVRRRTLELLDVIDLDSTDDPLLDGGFVYALVFQHEHQHIETMLQTLGLRGGQYPAPPAPPAGGPVGLTEVLVDGGPFVMGADSDPWAYDNELPAFEVELPPFFIDVTPVTNAAYLEFVESGGYDDPRLWAPEGWAHRQAEGLEHPLFWQREGEGSWSRLRFGHREELPPQEPVQHVCWYEADAFARWAGKRLPTEAEWEKAASWDSTGGRKRRFPWGDTPSPGLANLGGRHFQPAPVGAFPSGVSPYACHQMIGDVWEWTSSGFSGYPGFRSFPYREYSEVFFGPEYKVLRGGSWATHAAAIRTTFRNWDHPIRRQIFAGFRCARDP